MSYYRNGRRYTSAPLTPPAELIGRLISWRPKCADGSRLPRRHGQCLAYNAEDRTLSIEVQLEVNMWQTDRTRVITIPLKHGPFTPA